MTTVGHCIIVFCVLHRVLVNSHTQINVSIPIGELLQPFHNGFLHGCLSDVFVGAAIEECNAVGKHGHMRVSEYGCEYADLRIDKLNTDN